jgi:predicted permease
MAAWIDAFLPTFGLIALGAFLRARILRDGAAWDGLERLTFWVFLPALLASSIASASLSSLPVGRLLAATWGALLIATALSLGIARLTGADRAAMTSIVQGGIRYNTYIALAVASGLYGPAGLALGGVVAGLIVTGVQIILAIVFVVSEGGRPSPLRMAVQTITNPLLLGCLVGFAISALGGMPPGIGPTFRSLGAAALALGLLCVGAGLSLGSLRERPGLQALVAFLKLGLVPLVTWGLGRAFGLADLPLAVVTIIMAMPTATTAYVMARVLGGDARLMAAIITLQHVAAAATVPLWASFLAR